VAGSPREEQCGRVLTVHAVVGVAVVALGLVLTPGPNMIYLVSRSITQGLGVALGFGVYLAAATAGMTAIFAAVPAAYLGLKIAGAAYLLYLAWQALRPGGTNAFAPTAHPADPPRRLFVMGLVTNLLNPKIAVLYVALLPQFVDPARGSIALQSLTLGAVQIAIALPSTPSSCSPPDASPVPWPAIPGGCGPNASSWGRSSPGWPSGCSPSAPAPSPPPDGGSGGASRVRARRPARRGRPMGRPGRAPSPSPPRGRRGTRRSRR
jgi:threonine/homoserine/homoserine lactone efflux protein